MAVLDLDGLKRLPDLGQPPERVISLVPSMTESLFELGFGGSVVGITEYCIHPDEQLKNITRIGGPKNPDVDQIKSLKPDLVFANQEENSPEKIRAMVGRGIKVWVSFPVTIDDTLDLLRQLLAIYHTDKPALAITSLQMAVDYARRAAETSQPVKYFCPIWQGSEGEVDWWMTFNRETYPHQALATFGGENIFADRERRYPLAADLGLADAEGDKEGESKDSRYPRVRVEEILEAEPELILLPDEPFKFDENHKQRLVEALAGTPAVKNQQVRLLDGTLITWHGTRLGKALQILPSYFGN